MHESLFAKYGHLYNGNKDYRLWLKPAVTNLECETFSIAPEAVPPFSLWVGSAPE